MKIFIKLMILALVLSYASLFIIRKPDGTPIRTLDSLVPSFDFSGVTDTLDNIGDTFSGEDVSTPDTAIPTPATTDNNTVQRQMYRWRDANGNWQYGDRPPPGVEAESMQTDNVTVLDLSTPDLVAGEPEAEPVQQAASENSLVPERIRRMQDTLEQANTVGEQLQNSLEARQRVLEEL